MGINMPAWRVVIRDTKRFGMYGSDYIPVLEVQQMAGRAGRPRYDTEGEALMIAKSKEESRELAERYINGEPEPIYSKLSVEPVLRMQLLALIASGVLKSYANIEIFFSKTLFAHQYGSVDDVMSKVDKILKQLVLFTFIQTEQQTFIGDFLPAFDIEQDYRITATPLGKRVSQLYVDPLSAHHML